MEKTLLKNIVINFAGLIAPTIVSLATVPAYIHLMGVERYGVINLVWALIGYFSLLDLGTSLATENQIAKVRDAKDDSVERIFWGACFLNLATGMRGRRDRLFRRLPLRYLRSAYRTGLSARSHGGAALDRHRGAARQCDVGVRRRHHGSRTVCELQHQPDHRHDAVPVLPLAAIYCFSPSLAMVIPAAVCARLIAGIMLGVATFRALGIKRIRKPERKVIGELFGYGKWMLLFSGGGAIAGSLDRVLVGAILGARFVTYYATPQNLVQRLNMLPSAMLRSLFPRLSAASRTDADDLARDALGFLNGAFTPCMIVALFALAPFLTLWLGAPIAAASAPVGRILVLGVWLAGQSGILGILIQAQANPAYVARVSWLQLPFFVAALWFATHVFGTRRRRHRRGRQGPVRLRRLSLLRAHSCACHSRQYAGPPGVPACRADDRRQSERTAIDRACGYRAHGANLGWSLYRSSALRDALRKLWTRLSLQAN